MAYNLTAEEVVRASFQLGARFRLDYPFCAFRVNLILNYLFIVLSILINKSILQNKITKIVQ